MADSNINMVTPITAETFRRLNFNAGMLLANFDISSATDAESLMALIVSETAQQDSWLGATKGNIDISEGKSYWNPNINGRRMPFKGEKQFDTASPKITGTLVEFTPENVRAVSGSADITSNGSVTIVQPTATVKPNHYFDNLVFVSNLGSDGLYVAEADNVLCTSGINSQNADKDIGTLPFEFVAHSDSPVFTNELPIRYYFFPSSVD